jgi:hypothetical protein
MNDLPFHLGGYPDGTEPVYRCSFDQEINSYVKDMDGDSACRWNSIGGMIYWKPWDDSTDVDYQFRVRAAAAIGEDIDWPNEDEDEDETENWQPDPTYSAGYAYASGYHD